MLTTRETVTVDQIEEFIADATNAGDGEAVEVCKRAIALHPRTLDPWQLSDDEEAIAEVVRMLRSAEASRDEADR